MSKLDLWMQSIGIWLVAIVFIATVSSMIGYNIGLSEHKLYKCERCGKMSKSYFTDEFDGKKYRVCEDCQWIFNKTVKELGEYKASEKFDYMVFLHKEPKRGGK